MRTIHERRDEYGVCVLSVFGYIYIHFLFFRFAKTDIMFCWNFVTDPQCSTNGKNSYDENKQIENVNYVEKPQVWKMDDVYYVNQLIDVCSSSCEYNYLLRRTKRLNSILLVTNANRVRFTRGRRRITAFCRFHKKKSRTSFEGEKNPIRKFQRIEEKGCATFGTLVVPRRETSWWPCDATIFS